MARVQTGVVGVLSFFSGIAVASYAYSKRPPAQPKPQITPPIPSVPVPVPQPAPVSTPKIVKSKSEAPTHPTAKYGLPSGGFQFYCFNASRRWTYLSRVLFSSF